MEEYYSQEKARFLRDEIISFNTELKKYGIKMKELEKLSPKKKELRSKYLAAAEMIAKDEGLLNRLQEMKRLPVSIIMEKHGLNRKQVDRARKYIVALILIKCGDYEYLAEYIKM